jgi:hypothetical protein
LGGSGSVAGIFDREADPDRSAAVPVAVDLPRADPPGADRTKIVPQHERYDHEGHGREPPASPFGVHRPASRERVGRDDESAHPRPDRAAEDVTERHRPPAAPRIVASQPALETALSHPIGFQPVGTGLRVGGEEGVRCDADRDLVAGGERGREERLVPAVEPVEGAAKDREGSSGHGRRL